MGLQTKLFEGLFGLELSLLEVIGGEGVGVNDDDRVTLEVLHTDLEGSRIHSHEDIG